MDKPSELDPRLLEAIDACRPGSEDLSDAELSALAEGMAVDPELRAVYDRLKQSDVVLAEAFHDVPVPDGLGDRILDRLASARRMQAAPDGSTATEDNAAESSPPLAKRGRFWRRRRLLGGVAALVLAGSLLLAFSIWGDSEDALTGGMVEQVAIELFDKECDSLPAGQRADDVSPPRSHPLDPNVAQLAGIRWRWIDGFLGHRGVAYDLAPPGSPRATLYVFKCRVPNLGVSPPRTPACNSRNRFAAAWQSGGLLYVVVVDGGLGRYREVLGMSSRPWT